jgi:hypothetical protein
MNVLFSKACIAPGNDHNKVFFQEGVWYDVAKFVPTIET